MAPGVAHSLNMMRCPGMENCHRLMLQAFKKVTLILVSQTKSLGHSIVNVMQH